MSRTFNISALCLVTLLTMGQSSSQMPRRSQSVPVATILRPVLHKIERQTEVPIFLPSKLPSSIKLNEIHLVDGEGKADGWEVSLHYKEGCGDACFVGYFEAKRGERISRNDLDKVVRLLGV